MLTNSLNYSMRKILLALAFACMAATGWAQNAPKQVEAKGVGATRDEALNDALRNAIGMVAGVVLQAETKVENFELISDAISTNVNGYIASYDVVNEKAADGLQNVTVKAAVTTEALRADARRLAAAVGGIRFLVVYDERTLAPDMVPNMDFAVERFNQYLAAKKYRYIEKTRFDQLRREAVRILKDSDTTETTFVQRLGVQSGAQFIIMLKGYHFEERTTRNFGLGAQKRLVLDAKVYDNCTAEGLGTVVLEGPWVSTDTKDLDVRTGLTGTVTEKADQLMEVFNTYVGDWVNNGTPFELRFYGVGTYRELSDLRRRLQTDKAFGGQLEIAGAGNYMTLNGTFRNKPDELADKVLALADDVPGLREQSIDVQLIYGRQISFAPGQKVKSPPQKKSGPPVKTVSNSKTVNRKKK